MSKNLSKLQNALSQQRTAAPPKVAEPPKSKPEPATATPTAGYYTAPSREGKTNITAYLHPDYKANLRLIQAKTGKSLQDLVAEGLNDLFSKYDVPVIADTQ